MASLCINELTHQVTSVRQRWGRTRIVSVASWGHAICSTSQNDIIKRYMKYKHGTHVSPCCRPGVIDTPIFVRVGGDMSHDPTKIQDVSTLQQRHYNDAIWMVVLLLISPAKLYNNSAQQRNRKLHMTAIQFLCLKDLPVMVSEFSELRAGKSNFFKFSSDL